MNNIITVNDLGEYTKFDNEYQTKICVACFLFDSDNNLVLHRRGAMARDEVNKLEAIGGSVNNDDLNLRDAMKRELIEEAGDKFVFEIGNIFGIERATKYDNMADKYTNWVIVGFLGKIISGELINMEPARCVGFEKNKIDDFNIDDLSETCKNFLEKIRKI